MSGYPVVRFSSWLVVHISLCPVEQLSDSLLVQLSTCSLDWLFGCLVFGCLVARLVGFTIFQILDVQISKCPDVRLSEIFFHSFYVRQSLRLVDSTGFGEN